MAVDLLSAGAGRPGDPALVTPERTFTYDELGSAFDARAAELRDEGIERGTVVPRVLDADLAGTVTLLALWRLGAVPAPLNSRSTEAERTAAVQALTEELPGAQAVLWTSGSAGRPRGVVLSFENLAAHARAVAARLDLTSRDAWLASLSPAHVGGLALLTRSVLLGGRLVVAGPFEAEAVSAVIDGPSGASGTAVVVTHASLVPTQLLLLLEARAGAPPPTSFRCALIGGAHAPSDLIARARACGWPVALTYGMTEMSSQIATAPPDLVAAKPGTVGPPLDGVEVRVEPTGEILARGATRAMGYVGPAVGALSDTAGWVPTGDLGHFDEDGHLWVTGRRADRIVTGGVTVDAVEVEETLRSHPAVVDACVVGVPDERWGERVAAWVVPVGGELEEEELRSYVAERLATPKRPRVWHIGDALPLNPNGKVDRPAVRRALES